MEDLDRAIEAKEQALRLTPGSHLSQALYLSNLGSSLQSRFRRIGLMEDLDRMIGTNEQAVKLTPEDLLDRVGRLISLGTAL